MILQDTIRGCMMLTKKGMHDVDVMIAQYGHNDCTMLQQCLVDNEFTHNSDADKDRIIGSGWTGLGGVGPSEIQLGSGGNAWD